MPAHRELPKLAAGATYEVALPSGQTLVKVVRYDPIDKVHIVQANGRETRLDLSAYRVRPKRAQKAHAYKQVYLYLCDIGGGAFKVGASCAPEARRRQIRTSAPRAAMRAVVRVPAGKRWSEAESEVLRRFRPDRLTTGGREVFKFDRAQATACATFMRRVCA